MSLTFPPGPLAAESSGMVNYRLAGPDPLLFASPFPRRVRAVFCGVMLCDTVNALLVHATGALPQLYVPQAELHGHLLNRSATVTEAPGRGEARFYDVVCGDRTASDAVWVHPDPPGEARWLRGLCAVDFAAMDAWYDEDEQVYGHLRDPYHRVDIVPTTRRVRASVGATVLAESQRVLLVSETGLPNRLYVPADDVDTAALTPSDTHTVCPYKGTASYTSFAGVAGGAEAVADVAWSYPEPLPASARIAGHWCFDDTLVTVETDSHVSISEPEKEGARWVSVPNWL